MLLSWAALLVFPTPLLPLLSLALVAYFVLIEGYATLAFIRGARTTGGITHWRLFLVSAGSGLLALVIALAGVAVAIPASVAYSSTLILLIAILSGVSYYLGFVPPRSLRQAWQLGELQRFLREKATLSPEEHARQTLDRLCQAATRAVGGLAALVVAWNDEAHEFAPRAATDQTLLAHTLDNDRLLAHVWREQAPQVALGQSGMGAETARLAAQLNARALTIVPIATSQKAWGLLLVWLLRPSLFPDDDLDVLMLLSEQSAITRLGYAALLNEQQTMTARAVSLAEISDTLTRWTLDYQTLIETIAQRAAEVIGDACVITLLSEDRQWLNPVAFYHSDPNGRAFMKELLTAGPYRVGDSYAGQVVQTGQPLLIPSMSQAQIRATIKPEYQPYLERYGLHSLLIVPLRAHGQIIGTLGLTRDQSGRPYTQTDQLLLQDIADRAALAIVNAQAFATLKRAEETLAQQAAPLEAATAQTLTARELAVLRYVAEGLNNKEIGTRLKRSEHTVEHHLTKVYRKLGVRNRTEAVMRAQALGLLGEKPE